MIAALTGLGLSISSGMSAFIPLLTVGLLDRYTSLLALPPQWTWLSNGWVLVIVGVLLVVDLIGDKVPIADHILDIVHTVVRPTSGGISFSAGVGSHTLHLDDPTVTTGAESFGVFLIGLLIALAVHVVKSLVRGVVNLTTAGAGAPVVSTIEDGTAAALSVSAILLPLAVLAILALMVLAAWRMWRRRRRAHPV